MWPKDQGTKYRTLHGIACIRASPPIDSRFDKGNDPFRLYAQSLEKDGN